MGEVTILAEARGLGGDAALSDEAIVRRVLAGERAVYQVLVRRHNALLYRAVRAVLRDEDEVEDAMQQAYVTAYTRLGQFQGASRFSTWLVAVALNEARSRLRRAARLVRLEDAQEDVVELHAGEARGAAADPEREAAMRGLTRALEREVDALPEAYRLPFVLRYAQGLELAACAEALGVSTDVVKTRLHRAREQLRAALLARLEQAAPGAFGFDARRCDRVVAAVMAALPEPPRAA